MSLRSKHHFENPLKVIKQLIAGKSLTRSLFNLAIQRYEIYGEVLDLGSKNGTSSYYQHIKKSNNCNITFTDLVPGPGIVQVDVEKPFPFPDACFDTVITFHLMEHVYDFWKVPQEIHRVLRPCGRLILAVPFIHEYHPDPHDYWRMSGEAVRRLLESAGFNVSVELVGEGLATYSATKLAGMLLPNTLRPYGMSLAYLLATIIDRLIQCVWSGTGNYPPSAKYALDVICVGQKK